MPGKKFDFSQIVDTGGTAYVGKDEKEVLIKTGAPVLVTKVQKGPDTYLGRTYEKYTVSIELEGETRLLGFEAGTVNTRDSALELIKEHLESGGEPPAVKLERQGRAVLLVDPAKE